MKKTFAAAMALASAVGIATPSWGAFPEKNIQGVIQWGAGGSTDSISRSVTKYVEDQLGKEIVLVNKPGGTGVIAATYVKSRRADGYTVLYGAENPQLYGVLGLSKLSYKDFYPVNILANVNTVIATRADAPWNTFSELVADAQDKPNTLKMGTTGPGGLPFVVGSMIKTVTGFDVRNVPFKGDGPGLTALLGGHIDFMPMASSVAMQNMKAGKLKVLAVVAKTELPGLAGVPPITQEFPGFDKFLPWGPFFGAFVHRDVPADVKAKLVDAYAKAANTPEFQDFLTNFGATSMNISGAEAEKFLDHWQSVTTWLLHDAGAVKVSPATLNIPKP